MVQNIKVQIFHWWCDKWCENAGRFNASSQQSPLLCKHGLHLHHDENEGIKNWNTTMGISIHTLCVSPVVYTFWDFLLTFLYLIIACAFLTPIPDSWAKSWRFAVFISTFLLAMVSRTAGFQIYITQYIKVLSFQYTYFSHSILYCSHFQNIKAITFQYQLTNHLKLNIFWQKKDFIKFHHLIICIYSRGSFPSLPCRCEYNAN